jgi:hypothetical protein
MSAHSPPSMSRVAPEQPPSNWAGWLRDIARSVNQLIGLTDRPPYTFATLPVDVTPGTMAYITDGSIVGWGSNAAGGGATKQLLWFNGLTWRVLGT